MVTPVTIQDNPPVGNGLAVRSLATLLPDLLFTLQNPWADVVGMDF